MNDKTDIDTLCYTLIGNTIRGVKFFDNYVYLYFLDGSSAWFQLNQPINFGVLK